MTSTEIQAVPRRWTVAPRMAVPEGEGQVLTFSLECDGAAVSIQILRRNSEGERVAWRPIHSGPLRREDNRIYLADLTPTDGLPASPDDVLELRFKAVDEPATIALIDPHFENTEPRAGFRSQSADCPPDGILVFGTFDVENYGDLLFPIIAEHRLARAGLSITPVSPTGAATAFADAPRPVSLEALAGCSSPGRGVLIGGGNIVHMRRTSLPDYQSGGLDRTAYAALWIGATALAAAYDLPIAWNAPGVPTVESSWPATEIFQTTAAAADYVSVRDENSRNALGRTRQPVAVVPDTAVEISEVWPLADQEAIVRTALQTRGFAPDSPYIAVHVKNRSLDGPLEDLARELDTLSAETGRSVALVAIGACHGDDVLARRLSEMMSTPTALFDRPASLQEIAAVIALADLHVGSSLHGYITSFSYGRPGVVIAPPRNSKFEGFTSAVGRPDDVVSDWADALAIARDRLKHEPSRSDLLSGEIGRKLDRHWAAIVAVLSEPGLGRLRRGDFLRSLAAINLRQSGWSGLLSGVVSKA